MKYLYSGASKFGAEQTNPELSLGGNISSSPIPNDLLQNIFSEASYLSIQQNKRETKLIVLQNEDKLKTATLLSLNFLLNDDDVSVSGPTHGAIAEYRVAFVLPDDDNDCFESISNSAALPFNATFQDVIENTSVSLPDIAPGDFLGIWLVRNYDMNSDDLKVKDKQYWLDQLDNPTTPHIEDTLDLELSYTLV
jgi:hypothetical protein